jgi:hypothetical protein
VITSLPLMRCFSPLSSTHASSASSFGRGLLVLGGWPLQQFMLPLSVSVLYLVCMVLSGFGTKVVVSLL